MNKFIKIVVSLLFFTLIMSLNCYAGMADFTDDEAQKIKDEEVKNQQEIDKQSIGKSSNNFLKSLSVKGYTITPEFNKQVINYKIEGKINDSKVKISAEADDSRAKVIGTGVINLQPGENEIKIDCEAENGEMKSYFITVNTPGGGSTSNEADADEATNNNENDLIEGTENLNEISNNKPSLMNKILAKKNIIIAVVVIAVIVLVSFVLLRRKNKKSGRHSK